jgi:divalent metal cation (Fe/Co/Zn/Cd) transporter
MTASAPDIRNRQLALGLRLEYAGVVWMIIEASVAIASGIAAGSIALIAFGLDSVLELVAALVVIRELRRGGRTATEQRAVRIIGLTFFLLGGYVGIESILTFANHARPDASGPGIVVSAAALAIMPALAIGKRRAGRALDNRVLLADAAETTFCAVLAATALAGLVLNAMAGWWWADPAAGLVIASLAVREGKEAFESHDHD